MIINVFSLKEAISEVIDKNNTKNWISIRDIGYEYLYKDLDNHSINILTLFFDDLTKYQIKYNLVHPIYKESLTIREPLYFNRNHAQQIIDFSNDVFNYNEELNIHCYAGRSRSQAIGYVLNNYFNLFVKKNIDDYLFNLNRSLQRFMPNSDVLKILNEEIFKKSF